MADLISEIAAMENDTILIFCYKIQTTNGFTYSVPSPKNTPCDYSWKDQNGNVLIYRDAIEKNPPVVDWKPGNLTLSECLNRLTYVPIPDGSCAPTDVVKFIVSYLTTPSPAGITATNHTPLSHETDPSGNLLLLLLLVPILVFCWCKWRTQILSHFRRLKRFCCGGTGQDNSKNHVAVNVTNADELQLNRIIQLDSNGETQPLNSNHGSPVLNHAGMSADHTNITMLPNVTEINGGPNQRKNHHPKLNHANMSADLTNSPVLLNGTESNGGPNPRNNNHPGEE